MHHLYYQVPHTESLAKRLKVAIKHTLKPFAIHEGVAQILKSDTIVEDFLEVFLGNNAHIPHLCAFSNLSMEDKLAPNIPDEKKKITLGVRIPNHPIFSNILPKEMTLLVRGHLPYGG